MAGGGRDIVQVGLVGLVDLPVGVLEEYIMGE